MFFLYRASYITNKRSRGKRRGHDLQRMNVAMNRKLDIHIDPNKGHPLDKVQSAKLSSELEIIVQNDSSCSIHVKVFKKDNQLDPIFDKLDVSFTIFKNYYYFFQLVVHKSTYFLCYK